MGLSRNKVAVSEGAAGSPPFYGDHEIFSRRSRSRFDERSFKRARTELLLFNFQGSEAKKFVMIFEKETRMIRGCSSAGRAPALQAGGHGFDSHHLHQSSQREDYLFTIHFSLFTKREREVNERAMEEPIPNERENRFVAQVVRAHA